jgi:small subunit ribosomal protein S21
LEVKVNESNLEQALRVLKKKMQREGVYRDMKVHRHFEKPSEKKTRKRVEAIRRYNKLMRRRLEKDGY